MHANVAIASVRSLRARGFAVPTLDGGWRGSDLAGTFAGASGRVGQVPLLMSAAAGDWSYRKSVLGVVGGLTVADAAPDPRFFPLVTRDARFRLADNRIAATATLRDPESGTEGHGHPHRARPARRHR
jgi:hypothetical protein